MPFIFCSDAFPPWRYSFLLLEKSGSCAVPRWHGCATRCKTFQRNFLQLLSPLSGSGSSRAYSRDSPSSRFSIYLFFFFSQLATWFHVLIFHVSFLAPISTVFLTSRGQRLFFSPPLRRWKELTRDTLMPRAGLHSLNNDFAKSRVSPKKEGEDFG